MAKRAALGKGLGALLPQMEKGERGDLIQCNIHEIHPSPWQPRRLLPDDGIEELAQSIREKGILQPLVVRKSGEGYEIIIGERRWRAAKRAGLTNVPIIIKEATDQEVIELALVENLQREDLNPLEEAEAYQRLIAEFAYTQEVLAQRIGKDRSSVANTLRLLKLPAEVKDALERNQISMGHARALLALRNEVEQVSFCRKVVSKGLSVRETEDGIRHLLETKTSAPARERVIPEIEALREELRHIFKTQVRIKMRGERGAIEIEFYSLDDLERILELLRRPRAR
ncbi:MAG: ParB/RepB/Spo0J family partition protein [Deltaproteobacteria bacterium]|nr:ParB/RepB/Spo0J family partition protein [Deltaproteobacteria bacterium]